MYVDATRPTPCYCRLLAHTFSFIEWVTRHSEDIELRTEKRHIPVSWRHSRWFVAALRVTLKFDEVPHIAQEAP